jgi:uncharacterized protein (TIGR04141 family)
MPALSCYRIRANIAGEPVISFDQAVDLGDRPVTVYGPLTGPGFSAQLYLMDATPHRVPWSAFVQEAVPSVRIGRTTTPSALVIVEAAASRRRGAPLWFAFAFGTAGRFLLRQDSYERGYGLRTALNILYPREGDGTARLRAMDAKRRGATLMRTRYQVSDPSDFEVFDINRLRDVVSKATGIPADRSLWGGRIGGGDSLTFGLDIHFSDLGNVCRQVESAHGRDDYKERFDWIDYIQPITDPALLARLEQLVVSRLRAQRLDSLSLAPPEIVDWDRVTAFKYPFDRPQGRAHSAVTHPELRLQDFLAGLQGRGILQAIETADLRSGTIRALDGDGSEQYKWTPWQCLVAELNVGGETYILDEGDFFRVRADYQAELNAAIDGIPSASVRLPPSTALTLEGDYNRLAANSSPELLLLDRKTVRIASHTTPIEVCDLLSRGGHLIHVKRHLGSSDLSHLFAQGLVSAELLQMSREFRQVALGKVEEVALDRAGFALWDEAHFIPSDFEIVYAIAENWRGRTCSAALPFFSKVNLREVATNLRSRGFRVSLNQIQAT